MAIKPLTRYIFPTSSVQSTLCTSSYGTMIARTILRGAPALCSIFLPLVSCHMEMIWPYPIRSKYDHDPANTSQLIDYDMTSPLNADGSNFPCKGFQNDRPIQTTATYITGSTYNMTLAGSATHGGGSCQLSLSYDYGATFRVIKSIIGGCPLTSTYTFTIPTFAPSGTALFAWTWQNWQGNREFYMNCAEVHIVSGSSMITSRHTKRVTYSSFNQLPYIWKANLPGINDCVTTEFVNPVYPNPGPDVEYGDGLSSSTPPTLGNCDSPTPYGQTYEDLGDSDPPVGFSSITVDTSSGSMETFASSGLARSVYGTFSKQSSTSEIQVSSTLPPSQASYGNRRLATAPSQSYLSSDCPATVTMTIYPSASTATVIVTPMPSYYTTAASASACTGTSASCPCDRGYECQELSPCTWVCNSLSVPMTSASSTGASATIVPTGQLESSASRSARSTVIVTRTGTVIPMPSSSSWGTSSHPAYASGDVQRYLPSVPGTFI